MGHRATHTWSKTPGDDFASGRFHGCVWRPGDSAGNVPRNIQSELWSFTPRPIRGDLRHRLVCRARARRSGALRRTRNPARGDELSVGEIIRTFKAVTGRKPWVA